MEHEQRKAQLLKLLDEALAIQEADNRSAERTRIRKAVEELRIEHVSGGNAEGWNAALQAVLDLLTP